jgi:hypothetical protein
MTGPALSADGGVCGGLLVSIFCARDRRRSRPDDPNLELLVSFLRGSGSDIEGFVAEPDDSVALPGSGSLPAPSGPVLPIKLFFLNASLNRSTGDGDRLAAG